LVGFAVALPPSPRSPPKNKIGWQVHNRQDAEYGAVTNRAVGIVNTYYRCPVLVIYSRIIKWFCNKLLHLGQGTF